MLLANATSFDAGMLWTPRVLNCLSLGIKSLYISCSKQNSCRLATKEADNQFLMLLDWLVKYIWDIMCSWLTIYSTTVTIDSSYLMFNIIHQPDTCISQLPTAADALQLDHHFYTECHSYADICYTLFMAKMTAGTGMSHIFLLKNY